MNAAADGHGTSPYEQNAAVPLFDFEYFVTVQERNGLAV